MTMESCSLSNPKRDVCECSGNNIKLSECQRDISRHVQAYGLSINRDEISDEMDLILAIFCNLSQVSSAPMARI